MDFDEIFGSPSVPSVHQNAFATTTNNNDGNATNHRVGSASTSRPQQPTAAASSHRQTADNDFFESLTTPSPPRESRNAANNIVTAAHLTSATMGANHASLAPTPIVATAAGTAGVNVAGSSLQSPLINTRPSPSSPSTPATATVGLSGSYSSGPPPALVEKSGYSNSNIGGKSAAGISTGPKKNTSNNSRFDAADGDAEEDESHTDRDPLTGRGGSRKVAGTVAAVIDHHTNTTVNSFAASSGHEMRSHHGNNDHSDDNDEFHGHSHDHGHGHSHGGGGCCGGSSSPSSTSNTRAPRSSSSSPYIDPWAASPNNTKTMKARKALSIAVGFCLCFMVVEMITGIIANSIALINDAVHMLTDVFNLGISLTAVILSTWAPTVVMSFGYRRAEVIGALASVFTTWMLVVWILVEAGQRIYSISRCANGTAKDALCEAIDSRLMLGVGALGFFANIGCLMILMWGGHHGHSHGSLGGSHHGGSCGGGDHNHSHTHSHGDHDHGGKKDDHGGNMNLRGAILHVIGDCLQSLGVVVAAALIWIGNHFEYGTPTHPRSYYNLADPFCSILFAVITVFTTFGLIKDVLILLMEGCPKTLAVTAGAPLKASIAQLESVKEVRGFHVWLLGTEKSMCLVHVIVDKAKAMSMLESNQSEQPSATAELSTAALTASSNSSSADQMYARHAQLVDTIKQLASKGNVDYCSVEVSYE